MRHVAGFLTLSVSDPFSEIWCFRQKRSRSIADGLRHVTQLSMSPPRTSGWDPVLLVSQVNAFD